MDKETQRMSSYKDLYQGAITRDLRLPHPEEFHSIHQDIGGFIDAITTSYGTAEQVETPNTASPVAIIPLNPSLEIMRTLLSRTDSETSVFNMPLSLFADFSQNTELSLGQYQEFPRLSAALIEKLMGKNLRQINIYPEQNSNLFIMRFIAGNKSFLERIDEVDYTNRPDITHLDVVYNPYTRKPSATVGRGRIFYHGAKNTVLLRNGTYYNHMNVTPELVADSRNHTQFKQDIQIYRDVLAQVTNILLPGM